MPANDERPLGGGRTRDATSATEINTSNSITGSPASEAAPDESEMRRTFALFLPGGVTEVRVLNAGPRQTMSGYFDDVDKAIDDVVNNIGVDVPAVYVALNPVNPDLLARAQNRSKRNVRVTTGDGDILARRYLLADFDPVRPSGISATDVEHEQALVRAGRLVEYLLQVGFPRDSIVECDSGNGAHVLVRIDLPNDDDATALIRACLQALAALFDDDDVKVDQAVYNAARITKLYGTVTRKGDATADRPHRLARLIHVPDALVVAPRAALEALAKQAPEPDRPPPTNGTGGGRAPLDLGKWIERHGIDVLREGAYFGGVRYQLAACPFDASHDRGSAALFQLENGALAFKCLHNHCVDKAWADVRALFEPAHHAHGANRRNGHGGRGRVDHDDRVGGDRRDHDFPLTDAGNAERFAGMYGGTVRYDHKRHRWLIFSDHRWREDRDGAPVRMAKAAAREGLRRAADIDDADRRKAAAKWAYTSESRQRLEATLELAKAEPPIADKGDGWDADPMLLGVANGVVDLRTGGLRDGRPEDRMTLASSVRYDPGALAPRWDQFLAEIFDDDQEIIGFGHRALGYSITGDTSEQVLFMGYGTGSNGKSVLFNAVRQVAGEYGHNLPFTALEMAGRTAIPADIAQLPGRRLVTSAETNDGSRLNEARIKALTGGDPMTAAEKFKNPFTFQPVAKFLLAVNHLPVVKDDSEGFWRRMRVIPFRHRFEGAEVDRRLEAKLAAEMPGILAWMVRGAVEWSQKGLQAPDSVLLATHAYREESDPLAEFITDYCVVHDDASAAGGQLYKAYLAWADGLGLRDRERLGARAFGSRVKERFSSRRTEHGRRYVGIGLRTPHDPDGTDGFDGRSANLPLENSHIENLSELAVRPVIPSGSYGALTTPATASAEAGEGSATVPTCFHCPGEVDQYSSTGRPLCATHAEAAAVADSDPKATCPDCNGPLAAGGACWECDYRACEECGARTLHALQKLCPVRCTAEAVVAS